VGLGTARPLGSWALCKPSGVGENLSPQNVTLCHGEKRAKKMLKGLGKEEAKLGKCFCFFFSFCNFKCFPLRRSQNFMLTLALQARVRFMSDHKIFFNQNKK